MVMYRDGSSNAKASSKKTTFNKNLAAYCTTCQHLAATKEKKKKADTVKLTQE